MRDPRNGIAMTANNDIRMTWLLATAAAGAVMALAICALMVAITQPANDSRLIRVGERNELARSIPPPRCDSAHHFCVSHDANGQLIALYTFDPHIRDTHPCEVVWHGDREHEAPGGTIVHGLFDDPCTGSVYDITGHRLYGPSPRDLDSFPFAATTDNSTIVDTRTLVCGKSGRKDTEGCSFAPSN